MKVYQQITGREKSIINLELFIDNTFSGFLVAGGTGNAQGDGLLNSGFVFSGYEGYIFDQSGRFVGGYQPNSPFTISVHSKDDDTYSYFINDILIANNYSGSSGSDYIEFDKHGDTTLDIEHIF